MPLDAVCLTALLRELAPELEGARIDKVQQPERDLLLLSVYTRSGARRLLISAGVGSARLHFTRERYENPDTPPMFCMLLRKHLTGARIVSVEQPPYERLALLRLAARTELGEETEKTLAVELMGRASNVILIDETGNIVDCMRRADFGEGAYRRLLPGMLYRLPQRPEKPCFFETGSEERRALWANSGGAEPERWLMDTFYGLSPLIARETAHRAGSPEGMGAAMDALCESVAAGEFTPTLLLMEGKAPDVTYMRITQYGQAARCERRESFSSLLDECYAGRDRAERMRRASHDTMKSVRTLRDRQARKLAQQREELKKTAGREELRRRGDLITANLYRAQKGARTLLCTDYYTEGCPEVEIRLDPLKTPQQNAAAAYREYKKAVAAEGHLTALIASGEKQLDYLESVLDELSRAESEKDVADIRRELEGAGVLKAKRGTKQAKPKPRGPFRYVSSGGYEILAGRSNAQNDELTTRTARRGDIWLHTQKVHGSHVIIRADGAPVDERTLAEAAAIAVWHSQAREGGKVPVDYTEVRNVKKPSGSLPGKVIYTNYKTLMAEADEKLAASLAVK